MQSFKEAGLPLPLYHRLEQLGLIAPTPIQAQAIPPALQGSDVLGTAQTGTGKTAAYGVPLVAKLMNAPHSQALVLLPTRELATQVLQTLKTFIGNSKIATALIIGGEPMSKQFRQLSARPRLIVGTPGRINDHLKRAALTLSATDFLVLDEVDRMLDMGFGTQLETIAKCLTAPRQTLMFSATLPDNIQKLAARYLKNPLRIRIGETHAPALNVRQDQVRLSDAEKYPRLLEELQARSGSILVFVKAKFAAERMAVKLQKCGHKAEALHGGLRQNKRSRVIADFRNSTYRILVATDVAARGLDIPHIEHVINYDLPQSPEDYIHRIGRTARAGAQGAALSFLSPGEGDKWHAIQNLLNPGAAQGTAGARGPRPPHPKRGHAPRKAYPSRPRGAEHERSAESFTRAGPRKGRYAGA